MSVGLRWGRFRIEARVKVLDGVLDVGLGDSVEASEEGEPDGALEGGVVAPHELVPGV
jgi:hypothetical protein